MTVPNQVHDIVEHNIAEYSRQLAAKLLDGWQISKTNPGDVVGVYGGTYTISLFRNAETVQRLRTKVQGMQQEAKPDRATILANARAAKAAKKVNGKD